MGAARATARVCRERPGWDVARPVYHQEDRYWVSHARDPHWHKGKAAPPYAEAIVELARRITEVVTGVRCAAY